MDEVRQVQQAKQRFSDLIRHAQTDGPQLVTKHGREVAVVLAADDYRRLVAKTGDFKSFLVGGPRFDDLDSFLVDRATEPVRAIDLE